VSDELRDPLRAMKDPGPACERAVMDSQRKENERQALEWFGETVRALLLGYAAWLWWDWRGAVAAVALYALLGRCVLWLGWLCAVGRGR
jgi:hypothetical protein